MYTVEFQISVCCVWVVFVDRKLKVFTSAFPQYFWVIGAASRPHCSQCFHLHTAAGGQLHAEGLWAGRVWQGPSPQVRAAPTPGSCHLRATGTSACRAGLGASLAQGTRGGHSPGMDGQGHGGGLGRDRHGSEEDEGRCSPSVAEGPALGWRSSLFELSGPWQKQVANNLSEAVWSNSFFWDCLIPIPAPSRSALLPIC